MNTTDDAANDPGGEGMGPHGRHPLHGEPFRQDPAVRPGDHPAPVPGTPVSDGVATRAGAYEAPVAGPPNAAWAGQHPAWGPVAGQHWAPPPPPGWGPGYPMGADPGHWVWQPWEAPRPPRRGRGAVTAVALFGIAAITAAAGARALVDRPTGSSGNGSAVVVPRGGTGTGGTGGSAGNGGSSGNGGGSGTGTQSAGTAAVIAGVVDVNVTISGGGAAAGTGMVLTTNGEILTNNHVIDGATSITVQVAGAGPTYKAHVVGYDVADDVAVIAVDGATSSFTTVPVGSSSGLSVGATVTAIGNALGRSGPPAVTTGSITALDQTITASDQGGVNAETLNGLIQVDAPIQPGDSGGPLVSADGKVIGMDTAAQVSRGRSRTGGSTVGFAIPIDAALAIVRQIEGGGSGSAQVQMGGSRALLGVEVDATSTGGGAAVVGVQAGSPAATAGIATGDTIVSFDGHTVDSQDTLRSLILKHKSGDRAEVRWTDAAGTAHTATVTLTSGPPA